MATDELSNQVTSLYSHDETVAAITSYYTLLSRAHAPNSWADLQYPPPEGWPQFDDPDVIAGLNLTDEALELVRHIPYFLRDELHLLPDVGSYSYIEDRELSRAAESGASLRRGETTPGEDEAPSHFVLLGGIIETRDRGSDFWIDTKRGNAVVGNWHGEGLTGPYIRPDGIYPEPDDNSYVDLFHRYDGYGDHNCWRISTFFPACERLLRELEWIPGMDEDDINRLYETESRDSDCWLDFKQMRQIMRNNGWPGDDWNPDGVLAEMDRLGWPRDV
ncbi:hypothetical protein F4805DRAFT_51599 [Annulohypoxylon moriforme]|nr:hypothetical protein F4805DRAFT_51599 [Annulohypoxylon moriforme]